MTMDDPRAAAARFYDHDPSLPNDLPFYIDLIDARQIDVLELGCGTGRVLVPLSRHCNTIHGIDHSPAMAAICQDKLARAGVPRSKASVSVQPVDSFDLGRRFDLIIAPFRVLQNLATDEAVDGLFAGIHRHLAPQGTCVLNVFNPQGSRQAIIDRWSTPVETLDWEAPYEDGTLSCSVRRTGIDVQRMILYPELIYRVTVDGQVVGEATMPIAMRCYWPDQFVQLIEGHGFRVLRKWGGYENQPYGTGPELVVEFDR